MKQFFKYLIVGTLCILLANSCGICKKSSKTQSFSLKGDNKTLPQPVGYVNDFENMLTQEQENELTKIIKRHEDLTTDQIVIVTVASYAPYESLFDYSLDLGNSWGIGVKDKSNGVLIVLGKQLREVRILNGYGVEGRLTDAETKKIIDETMIPEFKSDKYFQGLAKGLRAIIRELK